MCGIAGDVTFNGGPANVAAIEAMKRIMAPRGPDAEGTHAQAGMAFGHRRLRIIDLSPHGQQPMVDSALGLALVFNGCIYNYKELRAELEGKGYAFFSTSDTEVILKAYHAWGRECVTRFHGMFAFAIHERDTGRVTLARDRLGIKPLYLAETADGIRFASSLPALIAAGGVDTTIDPVAFNYYMTFHAVIPPPHTLLNGVRKLPPATVAVFEPDGTRTDHVYWSLVMARDAADHKLTYEDWQDRTLAALRTAVDRRMVADVPVGVLLSGGLDSSLIVGLLAEAGQSGLNTFSVGFESVAGEQGDEFQYSDLIAERFATKHHRIFIDQETMIDNLPATIAAQSEPMVSYDNVGFYLLSKEVAKHVRVVQSGQGADEVFAGYHWYPPMVGSNDPVADYARAFFDRDNDEYNEAVGPALRGGDAARTFVEAHFGAAGAEDPVDKALRLDQTVMLVDDPVKRVDNMTMAWGLEARVPFLDHELVELAATMPAEHKMRQDGKGVLKGLARRIIPSEVIDRPKGYFPVPALKYIEGRVLEYVKDILGAQAAKDRGLFNPAYVARLMDDPKAHITPLRGSKLWQVALVEAWFQAHDLS